MDELGNKLLALARTLDPEAQRIESEGAGPVIGLEYEGELYYLTLDEA